MLDVQPFVARLPSEEDTSQSQRPRMYSHDDHSMVFSSSLFTKKMFSSTLGFLVRRTVDLKSLSFIRALSFRVAYRCLRTLAQQKQVALDSLWRVEHPGPVCMPPATVDTWYLQPGMPASRLRRCVHINHLISFSTTKKMRADS